MQPMLRIHDSLIDVDLRESDASPASLFGSMLWVLEAVTVSGVKVMNWRCRCHSPNHEVTREFHCERFAGALRDGSAHSSGETLQIARKPRFGVNICMTRLLVRRVGLTFAATGLACCYLAYGLTHPPKARAFHCQGVNTMRNISIVLSNSDTHQEVFPKRASWSEGAVSP
jgi:hypothetical protein